MPLPTNQDGSIPRPCYKGIDKEDMKYLTPQGLGIPGCPPPTDTACHVTTESRGSLNTPKTHHSSSTSQNVALVTTQSTGNVTTQNTHQSSCTSPSEVIVIEDSTPSPQVSERSGIPKSVDFAQESGTVSSLPEQSGAPIPPLMSIKFGETTDTIFNCDDIGGTAMWFDENQRPGSSYKSRTSALSSEQAVTGVSVKKARRMRKKERQRQKKLVTELSGHASNLGSDPVMLVDELVKILPPQSVKHSHANYLSGQETLFDLSSHQPPTVKDSVHHQLKSIRRMYVSDSLSSRSVSPDVIEIDPPTGYKNQQTTQFTSTPSVDKGPSGNNDQMMSSGQQYKLKKRRSRVQRFIDNRLKKKARRLANKDPRVNPVKKSNSKTSVNDKEASGSRNQERNQSLSKPSGEKRHSGEIDEKKTSGKQLKSITSVNTEKDASGNEDPEKNQATKYEPVLNIKMEVISDGEDTRTVAHVQSQSTKGLYSNTVFPVSSFSRNPSSPDRRVNHSVEVSVQENSTARPQEDGQSGEIIPPEAPSKHMLPKVLGHTDIKVISINKSIPEVTSTAINEHTNRSPEVQKANSLISRSHSQQTDIQRQDQRTCEDQSTCNTKNKNTGTASQTARQKTTEQVPESVSSRSVSAKARLRNHRCYMAARDEDDGLVAFPPPSIDLSRYQAPRG